MHPQDTATPPTGALHEVATKSGVPLRTAAKVLTISESHAYRLAKEGQFPCRVIRMGTRWVVPTAGADGLRALMGLDG